MKARGLVFFLGISLASLGVLAGQPLPGAPGTSMPEDFELDGDLELGRAIFAEQCALCHGETGDGHGMIFIDPSPRDLRRPEAMASRDDRELYRVIRDGGQALGLSPKMLPWGGVLSEGELLAVATFVRSLAEPETETMK